MRRDAGEDSGGSPRPKNADDVAIDILDGAVAELATVSPKGREEWEVAVTGFICRICLLSPDQDGIRPYSESGSGSCPELIRIGCACKDDLGAAHRQCAEAWFRIKGNRSCEICGSEAKNITGSEDKRFMEEWNERRVTITSSSTERDSFWRRQPFCNFLMACLIIAFMLPWLFRVNMY